MCRKLSLCALVLGLAGLTASAAHAQVGHKAMQAARTAPIPTSGRPGAEAANEAAPSSAPRGIEAHGIVSVRKQDEDLEGVDSEESLRAGAEDTYSPERAKPTEKVGPAIEGNPAGTYAGVEPGGARLPAVPAPVGQTPVAITWPGFQMRPDGTSRVFIQSTSALAGETALADGKYTLKFIGAKIAGSTNRLPLETRFFNTPVTKVSLAVAKDSVSLVLELRADVTPRVTTERGPSGYHFTYLDLPAGKYVDGAKLPDATANAGATPGAGGPPAQPEHMTTLDGDADLKSTGKAKASADASMDHELPPGIKATSKTQPSSGGGSASGGIKLGK
jgi:hypothetical protein